MKSHRTYTSAEKQAAIARTLDVGPAAASRELGISSGTLSCWAHKARRGVEGYASVPDASDESPEPPEAPDAEQHAAPAEQVAAPATPARSIHSPNSNGRPYAPG